MLDGLRAICAPEGRNHNGESQRNGGAATQVTFEKAKGVFAPDPPSTGISFLSKT